MRSSSRRKPRIGYGQPALLGGAALAISGLAFALRLFRLDIQSLWYDEGVSVVLAGRDILQIARDTATDIHPPLYYWLLHFWIAITGNSEFAVRFLSLASGVLAVTLIYQLGRHLVSPAGGLVAAVLMAASPLLVFYSQEARMYAQAVALSALSALLCWRVLEGGQRRLIDWLAFILASLALLYTHYFGAAVLAFENAYFFLRLFPNRRLLLPWLAAQAAIVLAFVPWLLQISTTRFAYYSSGQTMPWLEVVRRLFNDFSFGPAMPASATVTILSLATLGFGALALALQNPQRLLFLGAYLFVPWAALATYGLQPAAYSPKFALVAAPAFFALLASGVEGAARWAARGFRRWRLGIATGTIVAAFLIVAWALLAARGLHAVYYDQRLARDNYRGLAAFITALERPSDAIVLNAPGQIDIFGYYYHGQLTEYPLPQQRPIDEAATGSQLSQIAQAHDRIWVVLWAEPESDPNRFIEHWLDRTGYKAIDRWYGGVRLALYQMDGGGLPQETAAGLSFGDAILLERYRLGTSTLSPGEVLPLTLFWQATQPISQRYTVFAHLIDEQEYLWGQRDSEPNVGAQPSNTWKVGEPVMDRLGVLALPGTPPGQYRLEIGLYDPTTGQRLPIRQGGTTVGDRLLLGPIQVLRPEQSTAVAGLAMPNPLEARFSEELELIGYGLERLGGGVETDHFSAHAVLHLTLFWRATKENIGDYWAAIELRGQGESALQASQPRPIGSHYPTTKWLTGELVRDQYRLPLESLAPGVYSLALVVGDRHAFEATQPESGLRKEQVVLAKVIVE
ncbi:MAG: glycosyltransferase family 39 protein [Chloroflexi bacterium]|nr:glycosyltransferase family 39 protein [Chloroflexota bacterium]